MGSVPRWTRVVTSIARIAPDGVEVRPEVYQPTPGLGCRHFSTVFGASESSTGRGDSIAEAAEGDDDDRMRGWIRAVSPGVRRGASAGVMVGVLVGVFGSFGAVGAVGAPSAPGPVAARVEQGRWAWPLDGARQVLRPFIAPTYRWSAGHRGVDLRAWDEVLTAPAAGVVRFAGWVVDRPVLSIDHGGGVVSSYEPVVASVVEGEEVSAGQRIGAIEPGHCATRCVHLGVRVDGDYRNPLLWLGGIPHSVLLPTRSLD